MLYSHENTGELYRCFMAWEEVLKEAYPAAFSGYENYRNAEGNISELEAKHKSLLDSEGRIQRYAEDFEIMKNFFSLTGDRIAFEYDAKADRNNLINERLGLERRISNDRDVLDASLSDIKKNGFSLQDLSYYIDLCNKVSANDINQVDKNMSIDVDAYSNDLICIAQYIVRLACQDNRNTCRIKQKNLNRANNLYEILTSVQKDFYDIDGSENFTQLGLLIMKDMLISYLGSYTREAFDKEAVYKDATYNRLRKLVIKGLGDFDENDYLKKSSSSLNNVNARPDQGSYNPLPKGNKPEGNSKAANNILRKLLPLAIVAVIGVFAIIGVKYWYEEGKTYGPSQEEINQAIASGAQILSLGEISENRAIITQEMTDDRKYQELFDLVWKSRKEAIELYGASKGDFSKFIYSITTPAWNKDEKYIVIDAYDETAVDSKDVISIPSDIEGVPVMAIGSSAFNGCLETQVNLPFNIMSIGSFAFCNNSNLQTVTGADYIMEIGQSAFDGCGNLSQFDREARYAIKSVGDWAFRSCSSLKGINIGGETIFDSYYLGNAAFSENSSLEWIMLAENTSDIPMECFSNDNSLKSLAMMDSSMPRGKIDMEDGAYINCQSVGNEAFYNCSSISKVILGDKVKSIGSSAFSNCTNLKELSLNDVKVGDGNSIGNNAFSNTSLDTVDIPGSYIFIGMNAFADSNIRKFVLNGNEDGLVQTMDHSVLYNNELLEEVYIPDNYSDVRLWDFNGKNGIIRNTVYSNSPAVQQLYNDLLGTSSEFVLLPWEHSNKGEEQ